MKHMIRIIPAVGIVVLGIWWGLGQSVASDITQGKYLYDENCASCHGANLEGQPNWQIAGDDGILPAPPHNRRGHTWHHGDKLLFDYTKLGGAQTLAKRGVANFNSGMPGFADTLSDDQINAVLSYIKSTWPERERNAQQQKTQAEE